MNEYQTSHGCEGTAGAPETNNCAESFEMAVRPVLPDGLIRKPEVARRLDVDPRTIDNYMRRGWIPYYKVGKLVFFYWPEVVGAMMEKGQARGATEISSTKN